MRMHPTDDEKKLMEEATKQALQEMYAYTPEVREEIEKSLEHLYSEHSANHPQETSTSRKCLYIAVVSLLESGKSETFVVEEVLQYKGRRFKEGQQILQDLLQEGRENNW